MTGVQTCALPISEIEKGGARKRAGVRTGMNDATTAVHVVQAEEDLLGDLAD